MKFILKNILHVFLSIVRIFLTDKNIIIIGGPNRSRYAGNTKYLFEYLHNNSNYKCYWLTESQEIINYLKSKGYRYLTNKNILIKIYITLRCKVVIDSGTSFYDLFYLVSRSKSIKKISTMHGSGPKLTLSDKTNKATRINNINRFDCVSFCSEYSREKIGLNDFKLRPDKAQILGQPKHDILLNKNLVDTIYNEKKWTKMLFKSSTQSQKIIYYCPTWRSQSNKIPIMLLDNFNLKKFDNFLIKNNILFIYSLHLLSNFNSELKSCTNIRIISNNMFPLFDNLELIIESDMMIGDYSTLSTDYTILKKPQLFVIPDYNEILLNKGFIEDMKRILPGKIIESYDDLCSSILSYINSNELYKEHYSDNINELQEKYLGNIDKGSSERFLHYINKNV